MKTCTLLTLALAAASTPLLGQTILFQHDFSTSSAPDQMTHSNHTGEINPGPVPDIAVWDVYRANSPSDFGANTKYIEITDTNSPFGAGNQHMRVHYQAEAAGSLWTTARNQFSSQVITLEFKFFRPSETSWGTANDGDDSRFRLGSSDPVGSNAVRVPDELRFNADGSISGSELHYSYDTVHTVRWVYNHSLSEATYENSDLSVGSGHYDVWLDGTRIISGGGGGVSVSGRLALGQNLTSVGILTGAVEPAVEMMFDDIIVYAGAIPEPSTYALGAGILALGAAAFWRRRRVA